MQIPNVFATMPFPYFHNSTISEFYTIYTFYTAK